MAWIAILMPLAVVTGACATSPPSSARAQRPEKPAKSDGARGAQKPSKLRDCIEIGVGVGAVGTIGLGASLAASAAPTDPATQHVIDLMHVYRPIWARILTDMKASLAVAPDAVITDFGNMASALDRAADELTSHPSPEQTTSALATIKDMMDSPKALANWFMHNCGGVRTQDCQGVSLSLPALSAKTAEAYMALIADTVHQIRETYPACARHFGDEAGGKTSGDTTTSTTSAPTTTSTTSAPTTTTTTTSQVPVLGGRWAPDTVGFGEVRPANLHNGGDPTGAFGDIVWDSWGDTQARGHGTGLWVDANQVVADGHYEPIGLVAYDLEQCGGVLMYRHLAVYFPQHGETFDPATNGEAVYDLCPSSAP